MRKTLNMVCLIFSFFFGTLILVGCQNNGLYETDGVYPTGGFYLPIETRGYDVRQAVLYGKMTSSRIVFAKNDVELNDLLNLFCAKKPKCVGTMSKNKFWDYYFFKADIEGFHLCISFASSSTLTSFEYDYYMTQKGAIFYGKSSDYNARYRYTDDYFGDYEAVSKYFNNWHSS
ncbi:MAG: hypothetical protein K2F56_01310 [Anaeroplasmataceae bacterium]|nr:hypothetical protein [Anaeroplasmataceae bacterium]